MIKNLTQTKIKERKEKFYELKLADVYEVSAEIFTYHNYFKIKEPRDKRKKHLENIDCTSQKILILITIII